MIIKIAFLFVFGAVLGSICDLFHVANYITGYKNPYIYAQAWWTPLMFGFATVAIALSHVYFDKRLRKKDRPLNWVNVLYGMLAFVFMYYLSGFWPAIGGNKILMLAMCGVTIWYVFDKTAYGFVYAVMTAIVGCSVEISLIQSGLFYYTGADFYGIVYWLPFLYMAGSVAVGNLGRKMFGEEEVCSVVVTPQA